MNNDDILESYEPMIPNDGIIVTEWWYIIVTYFNQVIPSGNSKKGLKMEHASKIVMDLEKSQKEVKVPSYTAML